MGSEVWCHGTAVVPHERDGGVSGGLKFNAVFVFGKFGGNVAVLTRAAAVLCGEPGALALAAETDRLRQF